MLNYSRLIHGMLELMKTLKYGMNLALKMYSALELSFTYSLVYFLKFFFLGGGGGTFQYT